MPVITCPKCGARIRCPDGFAGPKARCPKCQHLFDLSESPAEHDWSQAPPAVRRPTADPVPEPTPPPGPQQPFPAAWEEPAGADMARLAVFAAIGFPVLIGLVAAVAVWSTRYGEREGLVLFWALILLLLCLGYLAFLFAVGVWVVRDAYARNHEGALWVVLYGVPHLIFAALPVPSFVFVSSAGQMAKWFMLWVLGLLFWLVFSWSGLLLYTLGRRRGRLTSCPTCENRRLPYTKSCPHCGHE